MIVDDSAATAVLKKVIQQFTGWKVVHAHDIDEAHAFKSVRVPEIVMIDLDMITLGNWEACATCHLTGVGCLSNGSAIIVMSSSSNYGVVEACFEAGADEFLSKEYLGAPVMLFAALYGAWKSFCLRTGIDEAIEHAPRTEIKEAQQAARYAAQSSSTDGRYDYLILPCQPALL